MRFVVIGDSKGKQHGINENVLTRILRRTCKLNPKPDFIVMCGDSVAGSMEEAILRDQLKRLRSLIEKYHPGLHLMPVAGNHEVNTMSLDDRYEKILSQVYSDFIPDGCLKDYNNTVYYKDFGDTRLIVLNAFHPGAVHRIDKVQLNWLEKTASEDKKNKIAFVHSPAFPTGSHLGRCLDTYPEERDTFWQVIDKCHVDIVISGHEHNYSRRIINSSLYEGKNNFKRNTYQIITGGGGEKLRDKYLSKEGVIVPPVGVYHFLVADILPDCIKISAVSSEGKSIDKFKVLK